MQDLLKEAWMFGIVTLFGAGFALFHIILLVKVLRSPRIRWPFRFLALLPPAAPVVGWMSGNRAESIVWIILLVGYAALYGALTH